MKNGAWVGLLMVTLAAMLWGTTGTAQALAPAGLPPHWVGALRLLFSGVFFAAYLGLVARADLAGVRAANLPWRLLALAAASMAVYNLSFFAGVKASSVAVGTAIALGSGPIWAGVLQLVLLRRSPSGAWWLGTLLAVAGGSLMVLGSAGELALSGYGIGLCLVAGLSYAVYALASQRMVNTVPAPVITLFVFSGAALCALPLAWAASGWPATAPGGWLAVAYLGVVATGVAYLLFTHALARVSGSTAVSMCLIEPLTAFFLAIAVLGERPPAAAYAGLALVLLGLALVVRAELRLPARAAP